MRAGDSADLGESTRQDQMRPQALVEVQRGRRLVILGFPCLMGCAEEHFEPVPSDPSEWISPLLARHGAAIRTLWLMHEPPRGTPLRHLMPVASGMPSQIVVGKNKRH